jgi:uncharacterized protein (TIGR02996 family)
MSDEATFLQAIRADPQNDSLRLVYADWLEEQAAPGFEPKAEFLRLVAQPLTPGEDRKRMKGQKKGRRKRLQQLAAGLDTDWLAVVSRLPIENCYGKRAAVEARPSYLLRFDYLCDRRWEDLQPTEDQAVRFCDGCRHQVFYCDTIMDARQHAQQRHCIAVDLGVIRRDRDLAPESMWLGRPSPELVRQEQERVKPDPVSAARALRKGQQP